MSSKVTLTGHFTLLDGTPAVGTVLIHPSRSPILDLGGKQVIAGPQRFTLDAEGRFSVDLPPTDDPALGEGFTYHVMVTMDHANWQVVGLTLPADMVSVDVLDPPAGVVKEYPTRAEWDALTEAAVAEMEAALDGAETARDTTIEARDITVVARDETLTARDATLTARDTAVGAAGETETARTETLTARDATFTARDETVEARDATFTARTETTTALSGAESARDTAVGAASDAETARDEAVGAAGEAETARLSAWEAVDTPGRQGPPGEVTTAALTTALAGKVTGTGMTVRVDNSVGTRVLLDHPGGTTMLAGETPAINALPYIINGWKQWSPFPLTLRRVGNRVYLSGMIDGTEKTAAAFLQPPIGYRPADSRTYPGLGINWNTAAIQKTTANKTQISADSAPAGQYNFTLEWDTTDPWPTT